MPTLVNSSEPVMEPNEKLTFLDRVTAGLRTQYKLKDNEVLYHIVGFVIEEKPPIIPETLLIGQTSCYAGSYHDVCGTSYGYAGRGPVVYRLLVLDNAIVFEGTSSDEAQVVGDFDTLDKRLKDGSVKVGRSLLVQKSEGEDDLDYTLVKDVRKLFGAAIEQLEAIPRDGQPLKRLPSPEGETWTTLKDMVKTFKLENAVTQPEPFFESARLSTKKVAELNESRKREEIPASEGNAESGPRAEDSEVVAPLPEGPESTDAQPGTDVDPKEPKRNRKKTKQQSVNDPPPKNRRDRSPSPGGGGQGPTKRRSARIRAAQADPSATTSSATKEGQHGRGAKTAGRTFGSRVGNIRGTNDNTANVLIGKDSLESASFKADYDVATTEYDPLTAFNLQNIDSYIPESNASQKVRSLYESMLMEPVMNGGQTHHNALPELRNIEEEVPKQTASGVMEDDIIDEEDNGSFDRAPSAVYDDPLEEQANTILVIAGKEIFNKCLNEATKFVYLRR
ncbi:hypothetical protein L198_05471 [Cryptococcus wingfieldii CBS 7118]|uniref:Uncharacterized protein n=1 Tax=Cryptococcus wingfieldii CBS 7118 TaxID=1295528 RepID=A0A1E3IVU9_9TREE|nr:hypothetical protein L198_05471 [Cryptococcus wingfieldii CBS 7118]ODN92678.1 hypothetical protein L198_05471 [Cryptococcus wingfieldii CBS 7118]